MAETIFTGNAKGKFPSGGEYTGEWFNGKPHGYGIMVFPNGDRYEGEWLNGNMNGQGEYHVYNTKYGRFVKMYKGDFSNGLRHGTGRMKYEDLSVYQGHWQNDKRTGEGVCWYSNGDCFHGIWKFDKMVRGIYYLNNSGDKYDGEIKDGKFDGYIN
mgnify:FL=1